MPKRATAPPLLLPALDPASPLPLHRQLYDALRRAILARQLAPGTRLPSTRALAADLRLARATVVVAYEQLHAEGYIEGRVGAGTEVARALPGRCAAPPGGGAAPTGGGRALSQRGAGLVAAARSTGLGLPSRLFHPGLPALDAFPAATWSRLMAQRLRGSATELLAYSDPAGFRPLREAIAAYLGAARAVRCTADQVIIVSGAQQGLDLLTRLLLDPGDAAWIEDPGYGAARTALIASGARLVPVPVDGDGLDVAAGIARAPAARLAYVTPSHQFPLGSTLSLARRLELLAWAERAHAWIIEDDYDSEYRYTGRPLAALQGLDTAGRVIYLGTFSKVLSPGLRIGYLIAPPDLSAPIIAARGLTDRHSPTLEQAVLADFITAGHFARHLRRVRDLAAERQSALLAAIRAHLGDALTVTPQPAGLHLVGHLPPGSDDLAASRRAAAVGITAPSISSSYLDAPRQHGLLLGYASAPPPALRDAVRTLATALTR
ncbi:MAG: PLP-dependent aminotransferase family protein [Chloroflexia bacterium]